MKQYHRRGPDRTTQLLIDAVRDAGYATGTLLDVGAGIGVLHHELLQAGCTLATHVDAAEAYVEVGKAETDRRGQGSRVRFVHADFLDVADTLDDADAVMMDRVVCCYPDAAGLVRAAAARARGVVAFSAPRERWYVRISFWFDNVVRRWRNDPFRTFVHPLAAMDRILRDAGLQPLNVRRTLAWHVAIYGRPPSRPGAA